jgi:hypothetical protein
VQFLHDRLRVAGGVDGELRVVAVGNEVAAVLLVAGKQIQNQLGGRILVVLPVNAAGIAEVQQEADDYGLVALTREERDFLFPTFVKDAEILLIQIGDKAAFLVGDGYGHDDFVHRHLDVGRGAGGLRRHGGLGAEYAHQEEDWENARVHGKPELIIRSS